MNATKPTVTLPHGPQPEPILESHWPDRLHRFVWRNWSLVELDRMAAVLRATPEQVAEVGRSLGLPPHRPIPSAVAGRGYITIVRRNWHELPYEQLLELLGWDEARLAAALKEDDFLWTKVGLLKPKCSPLRYSPPDAEARRRAEDIRKTVAAHFGSLERTLGEQEPRFAFIEHLSRPPAIPFIETEGAAGGDVCCLSSDWRLVLPRDAGPTAREAAERFIRFLGAAFGLRLPTGQDDSSAVKCVRLEADASAFARPESHEIAVARDRIDIRAADEEGLLQALQHIRREMTDRRRPELPLGRVRRDTRFWPRFMHSYFGLYGDPLMEPELDPFPDGYLERLSELGVNGLWLQGVLWTLAPNVDFPEFGDGWQTRLANLRRLAQKTRRFGIGLWLYLNEPRTMPEEFFANRPGIAGVVDPSFGRTMCTSTDSVRRFLRDSTRHVFASVPELAGAFTITASENLTNCHARYQGDECPRCSKRSPAEVIAEVNRLIDEGVRGGNPAARTIVYDWGWKPEWAEEIIGGLPDGASVMCVSEWDLPICRGGVESQVGEYSMSAVGPGPRALRHWDWAKRRGLPCVAKVQFNSTWEIGSVPYIPVPNLVARHCGNLVESGVTGLMLGWTLGGCPSPNLEVAREFYWSTPQAASSMSSVARRRYGAGLEAEGLTAWSTISRAFTEFPFHISVVYHAPVHVGPANLLYDRPTGYRSTMVGIPYDDLRGWRGPYPPEVFAEQFAKVAEGFRQGTDMLAALVARADAQHRPAIEEDHRLVSAIQAHYASVANQVRFVLLRESAVGATPSPFKGEGRGEGEMPACPGAATHGTVANLRGILGDELQLARRLYDLAGQDSRIGYEASNHYFYVPLDLVEKVINCQWLLDHMDPRLEEHKRRMGSFPPDVREAHKHCSYHRTELAASEKCGCFYCLAIFESPEIKRWIDQDASGIGQTALCPCCGVDSVIGGRSGYEISEAFLQKMYLYWFND